MEDESIQRKNTRGAVPRTEAEIIDVGENVLEAWRKKGLVLTWTTPDTFSEQLGVFSQTYVARKDTKGKRRIITNTIRTINSEINTSLDHVKKYLSEEYGAKNAPVYYAHFGIVRVRNTYMLPAAGKDREAALHQLLIGIDEHGFNDRKYGKAYWRNIAKKFTAARVEASGSDSDSSQQVAEKTEARENVLMTLNALINLIKANYPRSWKEELRVWGFQKEKY